jgi:hypothetical protein
MTQSSGFMFTAKLTSRSVANNATIAIDTPDASNPNVDRVNWEVAANGYVYVSPAVLVAFGPTFINVTNRTGLTWPQHSEVVLCCPYLALPTDLENTVAAQGATIANHETRITTNATNITNQGARVTALETTAANHETRIAALEAAAP